MHLNIKISVKVLSVWNLNAWKETQIFDNVLMDLYGRYGKKYGSQAKRCKKCQDFFTPFWLSTKNDYNCANPNVNFISSNILLHLVHHYWLTTELFVDHLHEKLKNKCLEKNLVHSHYFPHVCVLLEFILKFYIFIDWTNP